MVGVTIPIIDLSRNDNDLGHDLVNAAATYGFVYIKNRGLDISPEAIDRAFELSEKFFASPSEDKEPYKITPNNRGWSSMHAEVLDHDHQTTGDFKEAFNFGEFKNNHAQQPLPPIFVAREEEINSFAQSCHALCMKILQKFAIGLKIDAREGGENWFSSRHDTAAGADSGTIFRMLFYPALPSTTKLKSTDIRAGAHSDYGSITLLFQRQGQPGLEIRTPEETWAPVAVQPPGTESDPSPPILVNIGDLLSYWTNGLLKSTVHRVIFPANSDGSQGGGADRYSIAYFCHPIDSTPLVPVPSKRVQEYATDGKGKAVSPHGVMTADEHLKGRLAATYGWDKDEKKT